jgi:CRISPR-associated protein Cmr3
MSIPYLITFKPAGRFFFGTSQSFAEGFNPTSFPFPQQTTVLGAIRAKILEQNNCLDFDTRKPVGNFQQFTGSSPMKGLDESDDNLGKIEKLSPVFLVKWKSTDTCPADFLLPVPADVFSEYDANKKDEEGDQIVKSLLRFELMKKELPEWSNNIIYTFDKRIKEDHAEYLGGIQFWDAYSKNEKLPFDTSYLSKKIIIPDSQPGIARETEGIKKRNAKDNYFYRKCDFRLESDFCFGIIVHFSEENVLKDDDIFMGGERSLFRMKLNKLPLQPSHIFLEHPIVKRFYIKDDPGDFSGKKDSMTGAGNYVLISPFIAGSDIKPDFAIINSLYAPCSINKVDHKTDSFRAIPAGSILRTETNLTAIDTYKILSKIGYNFVIKF